MNEDEMRDRLVAAMQAGGPGNTYAQWAAAILPTVRAIVADELRAAADYWDRPNIRTIAHDLRERAHVLDPAAEEASA